MGPSPRWAAVLLVALAAQGHAEEWFEVRSPHFIVVSNASEKQAKRAAVEFEQIHLVFSRAVEAPPIDLAPLTVFAVDNERDLGRLLSAPAQYTAGFFQPGPFRPYAASRFNVSDPFQVIYHEYFHVLLDHHNPGLPRWLNEGLAEFWENSRIHDDRVEVGLPDADHLQLLRNTELLPIEELLGDENNFSGSNPGFRRTLAYAQAWALVHYCLRGDGSRSTALTRFVELQRGGLSQTEAAEQAFGDLRRLRTELGLYVRRPAFPTGVMRIPLQLDGSALVARRLTKGEAAVAIGHFLVNGREPEAAEPLFREALEADGDSGLALEGMGLLELRRRNPDTAKEWLARAVEQGSASHLAHHYYARLIGASPADAESSSLAERHLLRAVTLNPRFGAGYADLAIFYGQRDPDFRRALSLAVGAVRREPGSFDFRLLHARLLKASGLAEPARAGAEVALRFALVDSASSCNSLCWRGSLAGFADIVMPACDRAVRAAPDNAGFRDSRGVARAMNGDYPGAVEDFRAFVATPGNAGADVVADRRTWIASLEAGRNPFDESTLARLRGLAF